MPKQKAARLLVFTLASAIPALAFAQMRGGGGMQVLPVAAGLEKVPVGSWAEYEIKRGNEPGRKVRHALVGKSAGGFVLESRSETPRGDHVVTQSTVAADPTAEGAVKKVVSQFGDADPMEMPTSPPEGARGGGDKGGEHGDHAGGERGGGMMRGRMGARFLKPDPKAIVGKETLKLAGASFAAEHYRQPGPRGGTVDFWLAKDAGPFGLVKLELDRPAGPNGEGGGKVTMELTGRGKDAVPEIKKPAKPFDPGALPEALRARVGGGREGGSGKPGD